MQRNLGAALAVLALLVAVLAPARAEGPGAGVLPNAGPADPGQPAPAAPPPPPAAAPAPAAPASAPEPNDAIVLNFEGADIREVVHSLAGALGINYLIDPRVEGQVTIRTTGKIPRNELFPVFNQILRSIGIAAVKVGEVYNIVPVAEAKTRVLVSRAAMDRMRREDMFVVELIRVKNLAAQEMANLLQPFITPGGDVLPYPRANLLILTDIASNVDRLREMVGLLDRDSFKDLKARIFKIENADIEGLGQELLAVLDTYGITGEAAAERGVYAIPLLRLNSIAVLAFNEDAFEAVEYWLKLLDVPEDDNLRRTVRVYNVQNAKAADLATILNELYGGSSQGGGAGSPLGGGAAAGGGAFGGLVGGRGGIRSGAGGFGRGGFGSTGAGGVAPGGTGGSVGGGGFGRASQIGGAGGGGLGGGGGGLGGGGRGGLGGASGGGGGFGRGGRGGAQPAGVLGGAPGGGGLGAGGGIGGFVLGGDAPGSPFENEVRVVADEISNSLVILATKKDYEEIRKILLELDVVPRQVVIEVLIAEVNLNKAMQMGVSSVIANRGAVGPVPSTGPASPTPAPTTNGTSSLERILQTAEGGGPGGTTADLLQQLFYVSPVGALTALVTDQESYRVTIQAMASAGRVKILASPHILAADNREASIHIGDEIPILTSQSNLAGIQAGGTTAIVNAIQYRSTGVVLNVLPQINAEGLVNLQVRQEVSEVNDTSFGNTGSPSFLTRQAETTAVVQSGDSLLIGGIIRERTARSRDGVPYLMDLPVLGRLFRFDTDDVARIELIVLLTPRVVRNRSEALEATQEYKDRLWDVVDEVEATAGLRAPTQQEIYQKLRARSRTTTAEHPQAGLLPNRDWEE